MESPPDTLVLGPGGIKGILILGALKELEFSSLLSEIKRYIGVSVGSIICLLLICKYSVNEILYETINIPNFFYDFIHLLNLKDLGKIIKESVENRGLINNKILFEKLESMVTKKYGFVPTLKQLFSITKEELICVALDISKDKTEYISHENFPDLNCIQAVMASINIPFVFQKLKINDSLFVDGAFGDPYPINLYPNSFGILIETVYNDIEDSVYSYVFKTMTCSVTQMTNRAFKENKFNLKLKCMTKDPLASLSLSKKMDMFESGKEQCREFIEKYWNCNK